MRTTTDLLGVPSTVRASIRRPSENLRKYTSPNPLLRLVLRQFLQVVAAFAGRTRPRSLLEVGCGEGFVLRALRQTLPEAVIHGCDIDLDALRIARLLEPRVRLFAADLQRLAIVDGRYDLVVCCEVLEHVSDPAQALLSLTRASGRFVLLSVPHEPFFSLANLLRGRHLSRLGNPSGHVNGWTKTAFVRFVGDEVEIVDLATPFPWLVLLGEKRR